MSGTPAIEGDARRAAQAIDALRRGWAITVEHLGQQLCLLPIEMNEFYLDGPFHCDQFNKHQQNNHHIVNTEL